MAELLCPVCGDKVANGNCTFCGYVLTPEEIKNNKGRQTTINVNDNSYDGLNNCKDHDEHVINECVDHSEHNINGQNGSVINDMDRLGTPINIDLMANNEFGKSDYYSEEPEKRTLDKMFIISIVMIFFSQMIGLIVSIIGYRKSITEPYKRKFKIMIITQSVIFALYLVGAIIVPFTVGLISVFASM